MVQPMKFVVVFIILTGLVSFVLGQDAEATPTLYTPTFPITVESCGDPVTFESAPERAVTFDTNLTEIMFALGLEDRMAGYWLSGDTLAEEFEEQAEDVPLISEETWPPPGFETILSFGPDFVFAEFGYTFSEENGVTPEALETAGAKSYALTTSCESDAPGDDLTLDITYVDILNIGRIFGVEDRAQTIVSEMQNNVEAIETTIGVVDTQRGFFYGGGGDRILTAGRYAVPSIMMESIGLENIFNDLEADWTYDVSWEIVIERDPEVIIVEDAPWESAEDRIALLQSLPQLASITAIQEENFLVLPYRNVLSGLDIDEAVEILAVAAYPELFE